jgi:hypothetical protein
MGAESRSCVSARHAVIPAGSAPRPRRDPEPVGGPVSCRQAAPGRQRPRAGPLQSTPRCSGRALPPPQSPAPGCRSSGRPVRHRCAAGTCRSAIVLGTTGTSSPPAPNQWSPDVEASSSVDTVASRAPSRIANRYRDSMPAPRRRHRQPAAKPGAGGNWAMTDGRRSTPVALRESAATVRPSGNPGYRSVEDLKVRRG